LKVVRAWAVAAFAAFAVVAGGCGGGGDEDSQERATGPVAVLYVMDHRGGEPPDGALLPYAEAFRRVRAGCRITAAALANRILHLSNDASVGSGMDVSNLEALRAVARRVGTTRQDCTELFLRTEAFLGGGAAG
jgi:hypothetical protein